MHRNPNISYNSISKRGDKIKSEIFREVLEEESNDYPCRNKNKGTRLTVFGGKAAHGFIEGVLYGVE